MWILGGWLWNLQTGCVCVALPAALHNPQKNTSLEFGSNTRCVLLAGPTPLLLKSFSGAFCFCVWRSYWQKLQQNPKPHLNPNPHQNLNPTDSNPPNPDPNPEGKSKHTYFSYNLSHGSIGPRGHSPALLASGPPHPNPAGKCNQSESSSGGSSYRHRTVHDAHIAPHNAALDAIPFKCGGMFVLVVQSLTTGSLPGECHSQCMFFQKAA
jgi:hypothetical protein